MLLVQVPVTRTRTVLGEFSPLTPIFFPFDEPPVEETSFSLGDPALSSFGVPDPAHVYLASIKGGRFEDKKLALSFGEDGTLSKMDAESSDHRLEFVGQVVKSAAALAGKVAPLVAPPAVLEEPGKQGLKPTPPPPPKDTCDKVRDLLAGVSGDPPGSFADLVEGKCRGIPEARLQRAMLSFIEGPEAGRGQKAGTRDDDAAARTGRARLFIRANGAFERFLALSDTLEGLLDGSTAPAPGDQLRILLDEVTAEREAIQAKFFGTEQEKSFWRALYQLTPTAGDATFTLFTYSPADGICAAPEANGAVREMLPPPERAGACPGQVAVEVVLSQPGGQGRIPCSPPRRSPL